MKGSVLLLPPRPGRKLSSADLWDVPLDETNESGERKVGFSVSTCRDTKQPETDQGFIYNQDVEVSRPSSGRVRFCMDV